MKTAVIVCCCAAALILTVFLIYLIRLCHNKRKQKKLKEFGDSAFDKVLPAKKDLQSAEAGSTINNSPLKLNFMTMMSRIATMPKTPLGPKTPGVPQTPRTARFLNFGRRVSYSDKVEAEDDDREVLRDVSRASYASSIPSVPNVNSGMQMKPFRQDSTASAYSQPDKPDPATNILSRESSTKSTASSRPTLTTGSVKVDQPKVRDIGSSMSVGNSTAVQSVATSTYSESLESTLPSEGRKSSNKKSVSSAMRAARVKSQSAQVSEWSDTASMMSQESSKTSKSGKSNKSKQVGVSWERTPSIASSSGDNRSLAGSLHDLQSDQDARETLQLPEDLLRKQKEAAERWSRTTSSAPSSSKSSVTASENLDKQDDPQKRESSASASSSGSNMRRLDSVMGQLNFDDSNSKWVK